jgi:hypothetical protein
MSGFFLHVADDGTEIRFDKRPDDDALEVLCVRLVKTAQGLIEQTTTANCREYFPNVGAALHVVEPKGERWTLWNADNEARTVWRRKHLGGE